MRRKVKNRNVAKADLKFSSPELGKFINYCMWSGKKETATALVYRALVTIGEKSKTENPMEIFNTALKNTAPQVEVRSRRVGGANYQVPREVRPERRSFLAMKWIITAARSKKGQPMHIKLADEIIAAANNDGEAVRKKENTHKMAEANKAFAHFAW